LLNKDGVCIIFASQLNLSGQILPLILVTFKQAGVLKWCWCNAFSAKYGG